jgi:hypothetical protein
MTVDTFAEAWPQDHEQDHDPWWEDLGDAARCTRCGMVGESLVAGE